LKIMINENLSGFDHEKNDSIKTFTLLDGIVSWYNRA
jgi:hypothetical protein